MKQLFQRIQARLRHSPLSLLYDEACLGKSIRRSLNFMLAGNVFGTLFGIICGGSTTAMIGLANILNAGDLAFGILNGIPQAAALMQIPFSMLVSRTHKRKKYLLTFGITSRAIWLVFGLIPLIFPVGETSLGLWMLIFLLGISSCMSGAIGVCWFPWFSDLAPLRIRGRWLSIRDTILAVCNFSFGLLVAYLLEALPIESRYIIIFLLGGALGMLDMICFGFCEESYAAPPKRMHLFQELRGAFSNRPFMRFVIMWTAWCFTANMSGAYFNRYAMNEMGLTPMQIMIFGTMAAAVATILVMPRWGKALDRFGCRSVMLVAGVLGAITPIFYLLSTPGSVLPTLLYNFIGAMCWSGTNLSANSMQLSYSPDEERPFYIAVFACVTALVGTALGMVTGGALLENWHGMGWFSGGFDRYKALIALSVILRLAVTLLLVPPMPNDREGTARDMLLSWKSALMGLGKGHRRSRG